MLILLRGRYENTDKQRGLYNKTLVIGIILLFLCISTIPIIESLQIQKQTNYEPLPIENPKKNNSEIPLITLKVTGVTGGDNWYGSDNSFTFTCESDEIAEIYYAVDGNWELYNETFNVFDGGEHVLEWYAVDHEGNQSEIDGPFYFKVDKTKPDAYIDLEWIGNNRIGYELILTVTAVDSMIGLDHVEFYYMGYWHGNVYGPGPKYVWTLWGCCNPDLHATTTAYVYDKAGNWIRVDPLDPIIQSNSIEVLSSENVEVKNNKINKKIPSNIPVNEVFDPAYVIFVFNREIGRNEWIKSKVSFSFFYEIDRIDEVFYQINNGSWVSYIDTLVISEDGMYNFSWYAVDCEGNSTNPESFSFKVDCTPPEINLIKTYPYKNKVKFIAEVNDSTSGISGGVRFQGPFNEFIDNVYPYESKLVSNRSYNFIVTATVCDNAGNYNSCTSSIYIIRQKLILIGLIQGAEIRNESVSIDCIAVMVFAITHPFPIIYPFIFLLLCVTLPNNYTGYIGKHFIKATFYSEYST